jgi:MYXO-CTERM domain-containing protein
MRCPCRLFSVVLLSLGLFAGAAHAAALPWTYQWTPSTTQVFSSGSPTTFVVLTPESPGTAFGNATITALSLESFSNAAAATPAVFNNVPFGVTMNIKDLSNGLTGALSFNGTVSGTLSSAQSNLFVNFGGPPTQTLNLGTDSFTVKLSTASPGAPGSNILGSVSAAVKDGGVSSTPEPSTLALAGLGLTGLGIGWLKRRRRRSALELA